MKRKELEKKIEKEAYDKLVKSINIGLLDSKEEKKEEKKPE